VGRQALLADQVSIKSACHCQLNLHQLYMPCMVVRLFLYAYKESRWYFGQMQVDRAACFYMINALSREAVA